MTRPRDERRRTRARARDETGGRDETRRTRARARQRDEMTVVGRVLMLVGETRRAHARSRRRDERRWTCPGR